uniref:IS110 family transposase n=1 Tax=Wolbachia endosymbiont (group A) of Andrena hattorfiana TaxID=2953977 RepID=UPI0021F897F1|nr:IS110 family transposase [Wolbachia endosymbiont (group A) of Andrena hattorfiana]
MSKAQVIGGRFYARKALYMSAVVAMRHNKKMKVFYQRLVDSGKSRFSCCNEKNHHLFKCYDKKQ